MDIDPNKKSVHDLQYDYNHLATKTYHYYIIPLPNQWDEDTSSRPALLSTSNDEYNIIGVNKGEYKISVFDYGELPLLETEEEVELLYYIVTKQQLTSKNKK